ncbi:hypothetical protein [Celeribacter sp. PS-C1]|uniref:hypothetical protein n=1 Tax=Celeribacter sp. PS-C1 TaxID=2820813 RepID=UPI001CA4CDBF|nr:hypothetical protein [Celeribacter sp. PS-C1]MBW6418449.1 hypothetical protein [Celeribacter sp. PS-C1]
MNQAVDIKVQVGLCIKALEAIVRIVEAAGVATDYSDAYDEWEDIVQTMFSSFVLRPVCDSSISWGVNEFRRLGFEVDGDARAAVVLDCASHSYFIYDIAKFDTDQMRLVLRPLAAGQVEDVFASFDECSNFRIEILL